VSKHEQTYRRKPEFSRARRRSDLHEGDRLDEPAFLALLRAAVALNTASKVKRA